VSANGRLPLRTDALDPAQHELREAFISGPRQSEAQFFPVSGEDGQLSGPYRAMLQAPTAGAPLERLGRAIRYEIALHPCLREIVVLTVAVLNESATEWRAHEGLARANGVPDRTIDGLRVGAPTFDEDLHADVHAFVVALLKQHEVPDDLFDRLTANLGDDGVFELIATAGYYQVIAHINNAYALDAQARSKS
jgi:4-carboxymuconolactone decarboxylase